ncbi:speckle-type POZ protein B-like [Oppia nitens]|uniref:speckle-type POZ protein B-like n=1 Tax=Oppia nitens TaxID=1686743 RepID=UPI0023DC41C3|nr:speckle-type POZ protein B-like [Oppia nitens]
MDNTIAYETKVVFRVANFTDELQIDWTEKKKFESNDFVIGSDKWKISVDCDNRTEDAVSLFLALVETNELVVKTHYKMYLIGGDNDIYEIQEFDNIFSSDDEWSVPLVIEKQYLINNIDKLFADNNNTLVVGVNITVHKEIGYRCLLDLRHVFGVRDLNDCRLVVGKTEKVFYVSKLILSARSEVFEKMFTIDCKEKTTNEVIIDDIDADVFEEFLKCLYLVKCDKLDDMCEELLYIADKYMVSSLKTICLNLIFLRINGRNAFKTLKLMQDFGADEELMKMTNQWIGDNITSVVTQEIFQNRISDYTMTEQISNTLSTSVIDNTIAYETKVVFRVANFTDELQIDWTEMKEFVSDDFNIGSDKWRISVDCDNDTEDVVDKPMDRR